MDIFKTVACLLFPGMDDTRPARVGCDWWSGAELIGSCPTEVLGPSSTRHDFPQSARRRCAYL